MIRVTTATSVNVWALYTHKEVGCNMKKTDKFWAGTERKPWKNEEVMCLESLFQIPVIVTVKAQSPSFY